MYGPGQGGQCDCWVGSKVSLYRQQQKQDVGLDATISGDEGLGALSPACQDLRGERSQGHGGPGHWYALATSHKSQQAAM